MSTTPMPTESDVVRRIRPDSFDAMHALLSRLDPQFGEIWTNYQARLFTRRELDFRTSILVLLGQYTMTRDSELVRETVRAAHQGDVDLREVLETILQCYIYGGARTVELGVQAFVDVVEPLGLLDEVAARGMPVGGPDRSLEAEQQAWTPDDAADPRLAGLLERYGWKGISSGLRLRPGQHINLISQFDAVDPDWCQAWLDMCMEGMYGRFHLDDRTRLLCMVGDCLAVGDTYQYPRHMLGALRAGATPRELLDVLIQSLHVVGHPMITGIALNDLVRVLESVGRLDELADDLAKVDTIRAVAAARIAGRSTVTDLRTADGRTDAASPPDASASAGSR